MTLAAIELPHFLILGWMAGGVIALWIAQRFHVSGRRQINILLPMAMGLVVFTLYMSTRHNYEFMIDDIDIVETHPDVVAADGWKSLWVNDYWAKRSLDNHLYRPISILSYWVNARLPFGGLVKDGVAVEIYPRYFRGVNMVILAALGWILALWLNTYVQQTAAWLAAFFFIAHPSNAVLINYVVGRADLLAVLGIIGFLYMQRLSMVGSGWRWWQGILALLFAVIAFGAKETGVILVPAAFVQAWIGKRHADSEVTDYIPATPTRSHLATAFYLLLPLTLYMIGRVIAVGIGVDYSQGVEFIDDMRDNPMIPLSFVERLPSAISIAWFYVTQIVVPDTSYYQIPAVLPGWTSATTILGLTTLVAGVIVFFAAMRRRHWLAIGLIVAFGQFLLVGNLLLPIGVYAANRLMLPFTFLGAILAAQIFHNFCLQSTRRRAVAILPSIVVVMMMSSVVQDVNYHWASEARMIGRDKRRDPSNPINQYNFATTRAIEGHSAQLRTKAIKYALSLTDRILAVKDTDPISTRTKLANDLHQLRAMMQPQGPFAVVPRHPDLFQTLKETPRRLDLAIGQLPHLLDQKAELDSLRSKLNLELTDSKSNASQYLTESVGLLESVVRQRPHSINARMQLAKTREYLSLNDDARREYLAVAMVLGHDRNLNVIEAKVKFGWLSIEAGRDPMLASKHLLEAEKTLESMLNEKAGLILEIEDELHRLNKNAKRYLGIIAFLVNDKATALKRHRQLLRLYPDFQEARDDIPEFIKSRGIEVQPNG